MVRHHVKKNKKSKTQKTKQQKKELEEQLKNIDRFAGSSEEEEEESDDDDEEEEEIKKTDETDEESVDSEDDYVNAEPETETRMVVKKEKEDGATGDDEDSSNDEDDDDSDDDEDEYATIGNSTSMENITSSSAGMANAMSRILGLSTSTTKSAKPVVLSKTITPLQKQQQLEAEQKKKTKLKRKERKERNLLAMHIPLSVATTSPLLIMNNGNGELGNQQSVGKELESERMHRRVATRGVVALFNAISKHQQTVREKEQVLLPSKAKKDDSIKTTTKTGFLDMLKNTAVAKSGESMNGNAITTTTKKGNDASREAESTSAKKKPGWNALKDDFMMNSKLKDWDKDLSDEDDDESDSDDEKKKKKSRKRGGDDEEEDEVKETKVIKGGQVLNDNLSDDDDDGDNDIEEVKSSKKRVRKGGKEKRGKRSRQ